MYGLAAAFFGGKGVERDKEFRVCVCVCTRKGFFFWEKGERGEGRIEEDKCGAGGGDREVHSSPCDCTLCARSDYVMTDQLRSFDILSH
jgi:hypothetical protein